MTILEIIIILWLLPAVLSYAITSLYSKDWRLGKADLLLLIPVVNLVVLGLQMIILIDDFLSWRM